MKALRCHFSVWPVLTRRNAFDPMNEFIFRLSPFITCNYNYNRLQNMLRLCRVKQSFGPGALLLVEKPGEGTRLARMDSARKKIASLSLSAVSRPGTFRGRFVPLSMSPMSPWMARALSAPTYALQRTQRTTAHFSIECFKLLSALYRECAVCAVRCVLQHVAATFRVFPFLFLALSFVSATYLSAILALRSSSVRATFVPLR